MGNLGLPYIIECLGGQDKFVVLSWLTIINLLDMIYKCVVEHEIGEGEKTIYIKDSIKFYFKRRFIIDLLSI